MSICFICKEELLNIKILYIHFEYKHKQIQYYECVEIDCQNRKFDTFISLKRHLNLYHNVQESQKSISHNKRRLESSEQDHIHNVYNYNDNSFEISNSENLYH